MSEINKISKMSFSELLKIEFMKCKRSKIVPLIFIAPLLVVSSGIANLSSYFTPEYTNAWPAMFIQSALLLCSHLHPYQDLRLRCTRHPMQSERPPESRILFLFLHK